MNINQFKDIHKGKRCFVLATGPSLKNTPFPLVRKEITFGCNWILNLINWMPQYFAMSDIQPVTKIGDEIKKSKTVLFTLSEFIGEHFKQDDPVVFLDMIRSPKLCEIEPSVFQIENSKVNWGHSVIPDLVLPVAFYMGFKEVYLLGVDGDPSGKHCYHEKKGWPREKDWNGNNWVNYMNKSILACRTIFEKDNRKLINATSGGFLDVLERKSLRDIL